MAEIWNRIVGSRREARRYCSLGEELMINDLVESGTHRRIGGEDLLDEFLNVGRDSAIVRKLVFIIANTPGSTVIQKDVRAGGSHLLINGLDLLRLEWRTTNDECIQNDADGPGIHFEAMTVGGVEEHFRSDVVWCATDGLLAFARILDQSGKSEIPDLDIHTGIQKQVPEFEVAMNDLMGVHIMTSPYELYHKESDLGVGEATSAT